MIKYMDDFLYWTKTPWREALAGGNFWLCLWFSSIFFGKSSHNFHNLWNLSSRSFKSRNFLGYSQFFVFFIYFKFHQRKHDKSCSKDPCFLCRRTALKRIELRQNLYLSMHKLSNLSLVSQFFPRCFHFGWLLFQA